MTPLGRMSVRAAAAAIALGLAVRRPLPGPITVVRPLDPLPPQRLPYHAPQLVSCPPAQYPDSLKRRGIGGRVVLEVVVDTLGRVAPDHVVVRESPHNGLSAAAVAMARQCRFVPARVGRTPVRKLATMPVTSASGGLDRRTRGRSRNPPRPARVG